MAHRHCFFPRVFRNSEGGNRRCTALVGEFRRRWCANSAGPRRGQIAGIEPVSADEASLAGCRLVIAPSARQTAVLAWQDSVQKLRNFRQGVEMGRNPGKTRDRPGRSRWPEPASIRAATGTHRIKQDGTSFAPAAGTPQMYPRAAFGLPIVFHFRMKELTNQIGRTSYSNRSTSEANGSSEWPAPSFFGHVLAKEGDGMPRHSCFRINWPMTPCSPCGEARTSLHMGMCRDRATSMRTACRRETR